MCRPFIDIFDDDDHKFNICLFVCLIHYSAFSAAKAM